MEPPDPNDPAKSRLIALLTSERRADRAAGLGQVPALYMTATMGSVRRRHVTLTSQQLVDVWVQTFDEFIDLVEGNRFKAQGSIRELLKTIAVCRAVDLLRRPKVGDLSTLIPAALLTRTGPTAHGQTHARELRELVERTINSLPPDQRDVLRVYFDNLPESEKLDVLFTEYSTLTGASRSKDAVRVLRDRAIRKLRAAVTKAGYQLS